jgi:hypothetical protein
VNFSHISTTSHLFGYWFVGIPLCTLAVYLEYLGFCVVTNNGCVRIINWLDGVEKSDEPQTIECIEECFPVISDANTLASAVAKHGAESFSDKVLEIPFTPFYKAGFGKEIISQMREVFKAHGVGKHFHFDVRQGRLFIATEPLR